MPLIRATFIFSSLGISILPLVPLAFMLLAWNDVTLTVFFDCVFLSNARVRKKEEEERNSYIHRSIDAYERGFKDYG